MCEAVQKYAEEYATEREIQAKIEATIETTIKAGVEFGANEEMIISSLIKNCSLSPEEAQKAYDDFMAVSV